MALLRQCLQELRMHKDETFSVLLESPSLTRAHNTYTFFVKPALVRSSETLTAKSEISCSAPFSNPKFTAQQ